jgi:lipopolysaccharide/colanic/teichoic acid biosynthesis glycosyltransferase
VKRVLDIAISAAALLLLSPLLAAIALGVWISSGPPILFSQERVGLEFRRFRIYKFRTMHSRASGPGVTVGGDPRITRFGRFLRAFKLDELPQFYNVLRGDMSLVGPRPELPEYVEMYKDRYARVLAIRPGITDPASLRFRHEEAILAASADPLRAYAYCVLPEKLALAERYVRERSLAGDLAILFQTARAAAFRRK